MTFRYALVVDIFIFYRRFDLSSEVGTELLNFTDDVIGSGLETRVSDILLGGRERKKE